MKNKKLLTTTAFATIIALTGATSKLYAQSKNFSGPYFSIGATNQNSDTKISNNATPATPPQALTNGEVAVTNFVGFNSTATSIISRAANSLAKGDNEILGTASIGYMFPVDNNLMIGLEGSYIPGGGDKSYSNRYTRSTLTQPDVEEDVFQNTNINGTQNIKLSDKESWSVKLLPSYAVNNDLMLIGKVGYVNFKQTANISFSSDAASNFQRTNKLDGYVLGLGARYNLDKNLFLSLNFDASKFDKYTVSRTDTAAPALGELELNTSVQRLSTTIDNDYIYNTTISIGYKF